MEILVGGGAICAGVGILLLTRGTSFLAVVVAVLVSWLALLFAVALNHSRFGTDYRSLRVDHDGLWVKDRLVPPARLGRVELVDRPEAFFSSYRGKVRGVRIGMTQSTYMPLHTSKPGVLVEDLEGGKRPGWFLDSKDPEGLVRALEQVRDRAGGRP